VSRFSHNIKPAVTAELEQARVLEPTDPTGAFRHLERAHVLGQATTNHHVRTHVAMLQWAVRQRAHRESLGQVIRIIGAAAKTAIGLVPEGNTGGANVSPLRRLPIPDDLRHHIESARR
jgi:Protein of unknown function (DUF3703)